MHEWDEIAQSLLEKHCGSEPQSHEDARRIARDAGIEPHSEQFTDNIARALFTLSKPIVMDRLLSQITAITVL